MVVLVLVLFARYVDFLLGESIIRILYIKGGLGLLNTNFKYKNVIYINYINYLIHLATIYNSNKCCELLKYNLSLTGLSKISLKNNKIKYNKWIK